MKLHVIIAVALAASLNVSACKKQPATSHDTAATAAPAPSDALATPTPEPKPVVRTKLPEPGPRPAFKPPEVAVWKMPNGLEVWHLQQKQAPLISLRLVLTAGAATDPAGKSGLTSLTIDLLDEGAGERSALALADELQRLATDYGASAATDGVIFGMDLLADNLSPSLALLADILLRPTLSAEEFERRKAQQVAAAISADADPGTAATRTLRRALFGEGYGAYPPGGIRSTLETLTHDDVKAHYAAIVKPSGGVLVVVGAVERAALDKALTEALGGWEGSPSAVPLAVEPKPGPRGIYVVNYKDAAQTVLNVARRAPGANTEDLFESKIFNRTLGGMFTSRINMNLREDKGYTYGARSRFTRYRNAGFYKHSAKVKSDTTRASYDEFVKELTAIRTDRPISEAERNDAVGGLLLGFPANFELISSIAEQLEQLALERRKPSYLTTWSSKVDAVTTDIANATAKRHTDPADYLVVASGDRALIEKALGDLGLPFFHRDAEGNPIP